MPTLASDLGRFSELKCGCRREPGKRRTSASSSICCPVSISRNCSMARLEWPMVQICTGQYAFGNASRPSGALPTHLDVLARCCEETIKSPQALLKCFGFGEK